MANNIKGITIEIGGDTTKLDKALQGTNKEIKSTQSELREVERLLKMDPGNTEAMKQKQELLTKAVGETKDKLDLLKDAEKQVEEQFKNGEASEEQYRAIKREVEATEAQLKNLEKAAADSNVTLTKVGEAFGNVGDKLTTVGTKLTTVSAGIVGMGTASVAAAKDLDSGYDTIITKTGASGEALEGLQETANNVYGSMAVDMDDVGIAIGEVNTRFGATGTELETLSTQFLQFAQINDTDLNTAIDSVDSIMLKFGVDSSQTANVLGLLTKAGQDSGISMETLESSLQTNGAALQELGFDLTESVNLLAQMEASGVDTSTAMAGLKKAVANATKEGLSADEALTQTIDSIKNASSETEALQIATELFGNKGAAEMASAIRDGRLSVDDLSASLSDYGDVVETTFNETKDPWEEATVAANNLKLAAADLGTSLLTTLQPMITSVVQKVKEFTEWFKNLNESQKQTIIKVAAVVAAIGPMLVIIGKICTGISSIINVVKMAQPVMAALNAVLAANPIILIVAAIAALIAAFVLLYNKCEWFRNGVNAIWEAIKTAFLTAFNAIKDFFTVTLPNAFNSIIDFVKNNWQALLLFIVNPFAGAFALLYNNCDAFRAFIDNFVQKIKEFFQGLWDGLVAIFQGVGQWFTDRFTEAWNGIVAVFSAIGTWFGQRWTDITMALASVAEWFRTTFTNAWNNIVAVFSAIGTWFGQRWTDITMALASVAEWFRTTFQNAWTNLTSIFAAIGSWFGARWTEIKTALANIPAWFKQQFDDAWTNIKNAFANVTSFFSDLWEKIKGCFVNVGTAIGSAVGDAFKTAINSCLATIEGIVNKFIGMINGVIGIINEIPGVSLSKIDTLSLPRLAKGGVLREGTAMVAEAGPELISMVGGKAVVTPLTGTAANTALADAAAGNSFNQNINITSPRALTPYEIARQTRIQTRSMILAMGKG